MILGRSAADARLSGLYQGLIEAPVRLGGQNIRQDLDGPIILVPARRHMVHGGDLSDRSDAPQHDRALPVLGRFLRIGLFELPRGPLQASEEAVHDVQRFALIKLAGDDQHDVVRLIILPIKGLQAINRHAFDVALVSHYSLAVVVPFIGGRGHPLAQDVRRTIFIALKFIAHHGHLGDKVVAPDETVHEPVGFQLEREL